MPNEGGVYGIASALAALLLLLLIVVMGASDYRRGSHSEIALSSALDDAQDDFAEVLACGRVITPEDALAAAVVAGEKSMINPVEGVFESIAIAARIDIATFDRISLGPAQISRRHFESAQLEGTDFWGTVGSTCASVQYVRSWIAEQGEDVTKIDGRLAIYHHWSGTDIDAMKPGSYSGNLYREFLEALYGWAVLSKLSGP